SQGLLSRLQPAIHVAADRPGQVPRLLHGDPRRPPAALPAAAAAAGARAIGRGAGAFPARLRSRGAAVLFRRPRSAGGGRERFAAPRHLPRRPSPPGRRRLRGGALRLPDRPPGSRHPARVVLRSAEARHRVLEHACRSRNGAGPSRTTQRRDAAMTDRPTGRDVPTDAADLLAARAAGVLWWRQPLPRRARAAPATAPAAAKTGMTTEAGAAPAPAAGAAAP